MSKKTLKLLNYIPFILFLIIMFYFTQSVGLKGDDFKYLLRSSYNFTLPAERFNSFRETIQSAYYDYMLQDSRFVSTVLVTNVLRADLKVYQILNPIIITLSFYFGLRLSANHRFDTKKDIFINSVCMLCFFSITPSLLDDAVFWVTGAVFYAWTLLSIVLILRLIINKDIKSTFLSYVLYTYVSLRTAFAVENMSLSISFVCLLFVVLNVFFYKDKNYFKGVRRYAFIILWIFNCVQIMSPGIRLRALQINNSTIQTIVKGVRYFIQSQYISGGYISCFLILLLSIYIKKYNNKLFYISLFISIPFLIISTFYFFPWGKSFIYSNHFLSLLLEQLDIFLLMDGQFIISIVLYYFILSCVIAYEVVYIYVKEKDQQFLCLLIMSFITNVAIMPLGGASERTQYFSQFFMILAISLLLNRCCNNIFSRIVKFVYVGLFIILFINKSTYLSSNVQVNQIREKIYKDIKRNGCPSNESIKIPKYRYSMIGNFDNYYSFYDSFKEDYLEVDNTCQIDFVDRIEFGVKW